MSDEPKIELPEFRVSEYVSSTGVGFDIRPLTGHFTESQAKEVIRRAEKVYPVFEKIKAALEEIRDGERTCCPRCEGNGKLWADGKAHYPSENVDTINCGNCGGSGYLQPENAQEIAEQALAEAEKAEKK